MDFAKNVLEDALNEAESKLEEEKGLKEFDTSSLVQNVIDDKIQVDGAGAEEKSAVSPFFFFLIFIIIVWVGIAVSFNLMGSFGRAVNQLAPAEDTSFTDFCLQKVSSAQFSAEELCKVGQKAITAGTTDEKSVKKLCGELSFDPRLSSVCQKDLSPLFAEFKVTG